MKHLSVICIAIMIFCSCNKEDKVNYSNLEGAYSGTRYYMHQDYDSNHNIVVFRDTQYNFHAILWFNRKTDEINFMDALYLPPVEVGEVIQAYKETLAMNPNESIRIFQSEKRVQLDSFYNNQGGGPEADVVMYEFYKD